jgi:hypothetical protein
VTSRLYRSTRLLATRAALVLRHLGIDGVGTPTTAALISLYITGLVLLDGHRRQTRVTRFPPGRYHDALNGLLRLMPRSIRALMELLYGRLPLHRRRGVREGVCQEAALGVL